MSVDPGEFEEISHCGGQVIFRVLMGDDGRRGYQITYQGFGGPRAIFAVYALPQGAAVGPIKLGGIGQPWNPAPIPGCFPVFIASDSQDSVGQPRQVWPPVPEVSGLLAWRGFSLFLLRNQSAAA